MKPKTELFLNIYLFIYVLLYMGFLSIISFLHSSFSIISILAITIPFILLAIWSLLLLRSNSNSNNNRKVKHKRILVMSVLPPLLCLLLLGVNEYNSKFNTEKWLNKPNDRVYMIDNLLENHKLKGMTKAEVFKLLGHPDRKFNSKLNYFLGTERGLIKIDNEQLIVKLDDKDAVINYRLTTD